MNTTSLQLDELLEAANRRLQSTPDLAAVGPFSRRTFHYYVQQGLLPGRGGRRGPGSRYSPALIERLLRIRQLQRQQGLSLAEIRLILEPAPALSPHAVASPESTTASPMQADLTADMPDDMPSDGYGDIPVLTSAVALPMKELLDAGTGTGEMAAGSCEDRPGDGPGAGPLPSTTADGVARNAVPSLSACLREEAAQVNLPAAQRFPIGSNAELLVHQPLSPRQARQLSAARALLRSILEEDS